MLKNEPLDAKIGVDTAENEPPKGFKKCMLVRAPLVIVVSRPKTDERCMLVTSGLKESNDVTNIKTTAESSSGIKNGH